MEQVFIWSPMTIPGMPSCVVPRAIGFKCCKRIDCNQSFVPNVYLGEEPKKYYPPLRILVYPLLWLFIKRYGDDEKDLLAP